MRLRRRLGEVFAGLIGCVVACLAIYVFLVGLDHFANGIFTPHLDREGYIRNPSLIDLFAPPVETAYRASIIKSIQLGSCTLASDTCAITLSPAVTVKNTIVIVDGATDSVDAGADPYEQDVTATLTSTTNVTVTNRTAHAGMTVDVLTTEYYANAFTANGVQRGVITLGAAETTHDATITALTGTKAKPLTCGRVLTGTGNSTQARVLTRLSLTSTTNVRATIAVASNATMATCYQVPDWP